MKTPDYKEEYCPHCQQSTTYLLAIDQGTVHIVKQIARFIGRKGSNMVHPRNEMEPAWLTSNEVGNLSRARSHGLIARVKDSPGHYLLTHKGAQFLHGKAIPKYAIISKVEKHQIGYWKPEENMVTVNDFNGSGEYWEGIGYSIGQDNYMTKLERELESLPKLF